MVDGERTGDSMIEVLVWLLVSVSDGASNRGNISVLERFASEAQCEHVKANIPAHDSLFRARCVQARILVQK